MLELLVKAAKGETLDGTIDLGFGIGLKKQRILLRLLKSLDYTFPNLKEYKKDDCEVIFDTTNNSYRLMVDGQEWMCYKAKEHDEAFELYSHYDLAQGHCICTGLGFGIRENWILNKKGVTKVTVLEKNKSVIDYHRFNSPKFFDDVEVIQTDVYDYKGKCDTLLLDHYQYGTEAKQANLPNQNTAILVPFTAIANVILQNSAKVLKNIECDTMWLWSLEHIVGSKEVESDVSKLFIYNDIKTHFGLHALPDLTEEKLSLYYSIYKSETINILKHLNQGKENAS